MSSARSKWRLWLGLVGISLVVSAVAAHSELVVSFTTVPNVAPPGTIVAVTDGFQRSLLHQDDQTPSVSRQADGTWLLRIRPTIPFDRLLHTVVIITTDRGRAVVTPSAAFTHIDRNGKRIYLAPLTLR